MRFLSRVFQWWAVFLCCHAVIDLFEVFVVSLLLLDLEGAGVHQISLSVNVVRGDQMLQSSFPHFFTPNTYFLK